MYRAVQSALLSSGCIISLAFRFMFALWLAMHRGAAARLDQHVQLVAERRPEHVWLVRGAAGAQDGDMAAQIYVVRTCAAAAGYHGAQLPLLL